jgi:hypothetical protein
MVNGEKIIMNKKQGGTLEEWQIHTHHLNKEPLCLTGYLVEAGDERQYIQVGSHLRSSKIEKLTKTDYGYLCETLNTFYKLKGEGNNDPSIGEDNVQLAINLHYI